MKRKDKRSLSAMVVLALMTGTPVCLATEAGFDHVCSWSAYDPGEHGVGDDPDGYDGAVFDGRYVYFVPSGQNTFYHDEVLRYDTTADYANAASWTAFDPGENGVGNPAKGYAGGVFDGRYVYFIPFKSAGNYHGTVLRYDTTADFDSASSWIVFDPGDHGLGSDPDGYVGGTFDGRYVYFAPSHNGAAFHGEVLRYDTTADFSTLASWAAFDPGGNGVGSDPDGYNGVVFDGRYVYFAPNYNGTRHHGEVLRHDTTGDFSDTASWTTYDPGANGVGLDPDGFHGAVFDGRYVYFVPYHNGTRYYGEVLRLDTTGEFSDRNAWAAYDPGSHGVGDHADGFHGAVFDGRFVYFIPNHIAAGDHSEVLRFDTSDDFTNASSWTAFDPGDYGVIEEAGGYHRGAFDGRFIYFAPAGWQPAHGEVLRFDTATCLGDLDHDGDVDLSDLAQLLANYNMTSDATCENGDLDNDGDVDLSDLAALLGVYGTLCE